MNLSERLETFILLGHYLRNPNSQFDLVNLAQKACSGNPWFRPDQVSLALNAISEEYLIASKLNKWTNKYPPEPLTSRSVGVVLAGNIPAIGFHDLLAVLLSGHRLMAKLSSNDFVLIQFFLQKITEINPGFSSRIQLVERINTADAYIATGSDNTARYFHYYFAKKPHIIRKNRTSVAILTGNESDEELNGLEHDLLDYFGLGCRNVSTLFVPYNYSFERLLEYLESRAITYTSHHKYTNNYDYNKAVYLINQIPHYDNGLLLLTENDSLVSPISVVYFQRYRSLEEVAKRINAFSEKIQCIVSSKGTFPGSIPFGQTQRPQLMDYADGLDTMKFLKSL